MQTGNVSFQPNKKVGNYTFNSQKLLGSGSYSTVYLGVNEDTQETVAIKVIDRRSIADEYMYETLLSEIEILKNLDHPNILKLHDVLNTVNNIYIITEYCNGGTLDELLKKEKTIPEDRALLIMKDLLCGYQEILKHNIVHRDIKPANIFINEGKYKIGDFGFAKKVGNLSDPLMKSIVGTPLYMSPECLENKYYSSKNDVYSLGIILFKLLFGRTPWPSRTRVELINNMYSSPLIIPNDEQISMQTKQFLVKALQYRELERIDWGEIYENPIFGMDESVKEKKEVYSDDKENKQNITFGSKIVGLHLKIIQKIDSVVKKLQKNSLPTSETSFQLATFLIQAENYYIIDLEDRLLKEERKNMKEKDIIKLIENNVRELQKRNSNELKKLKKKYSQKEKNPEKSMFEEILENMKQVVRELNHKIFDKKSNEKDVEFLKELVGLYQMSAKFSSVKDVKEFSELLAKIEIVGKEICEDFAGMTYQSLRKIIYDLGI